MVTGSTGGDLMVWRATKGHQLTPSLAKITVHQSGVNCLQVDNQNRSKNEVTLDILQVKATAVKGEHLILSGGDDCMVALSRLVIDMRGGEVEEFQKLWDTTSSNWSHSAQVRSQLLPLFNLSTQDHSF